VWVRRRCTVGRRVCRSRASYRASTTFRS
jgi:hypothetical protein